MKTERNLTNLAVAMFALNLSILSFYSLICVTTTFRICDSLRAHDFLTSVRQIPRYPWQMPVQSLGLYAVLFGVSFFKIFSWYLLFRLFLLFSLVIIHSNWYSEMTKFKTV